MTAYENKRFNICLKLKQAKERCITMRDSKPSNAYVIEEKKQAKQKELAALVNELVK